MKILVLKEKYEDRYISLENNEERVYYKILSERIKNNWYDDETSKLADKALDKAWLRGDKRSCKNFLLSRIHHEYENMFETELELLT